MKIKKISIENFGTVSNYSLDLDSGINTLLEDNGWGKSTLAAFVRIMFYGFEGERSRKSIKEKEREFFRPWNGGTFGGVIEFETSKGEYILTRTFGHTKKDEDTFDLRDAVTKKESSDYNSEEIGKALFGLDSENYQKTSFISHEGVKYSGVGSEVGSKVSSAPQADDLAEYDRACSLMKDYLNSHSPRGARGSLSKQKSEISELKHETDRVSDVTGRLENERSLLKNIEEECGALRQKKRLLEEEKKGLLITREKTLKKTTLEEKKNNVLKRENGIKKLHEESCVQNADEDLISKAEGKISELAGLAVKFETKKASSVDENLVRLKRKYGEDIPDGDEIQARIDDMDLIQEMIHKHDGIEDMIEREKEAAEDERRRREEAKREREALNRKKLFTANALIIAGVISFLLTAAGCAALLILVPAKVFGIIEGALSLIGIVLIIVGAVSKGKLRRQGDGTEDLYDRSSEVIESLRNKSKEYDQRIKDKERVVSDYLKRFDIDYYRSDAADILYSIKSETADYRKSRKAQIALREEIDSLAETGKSICDEIRDIFSKLGMGGAEPIFPGENTGLRKKLEELKKAISEQGFMKSELESARADLEVFLSENPGIEEMEVPDPGELDAYESKLDSDIRSIDAELDEKSKEISGFWRRIDDLSGELEDLNAKKETLDSLSESYASELHRYGIVKKTEELLGRAKDTLISGYMAPLRCSFEKYYDILKDSDDIGGSSDFLIDTNLEIKKKEAGSYHDILTLSDGFGDRVGLCMRAAFLDVMYSDEKPVVIMDDPFSNFDEKNIEWGWRFLELLSREYQIVYMTCHADRTKENFTL